jgi:hypothetical protein
MQQTNEDDDTANVEAASVRSYCHDDDPGDRCHDGHGGFCRKAKSPGESVHDEPCDK